jgi:hypothetical protein
MRNLTGTLCLTLFIILGNAGLSWSADKSAGDNVSEGFLTTLVVVRVLDQEVTFPEIKFKDGSTVRRTSKKSYSPRSAEEMEIILEDGILDAGLEYIMYEDFAEECNAPDQSKIRELFVAKGRIPYLMPRDAFKKSMRECEIIYFMTVKLTVDVVSEKGWVLFEGEAMVFELQKRKYRIIDIARFEGRSAGGGDVVDAEQTVAAYLVGGKVTGSNKVYKGKLLQKVRINLEAKHRK